MATVESTIPDLLLIHLGALVLVPALPVAYPDVPFTSPTAAYLEARYMPNTNVNLFLGNDATVQYRGLLQVTLVYQAGKGIIVPAEIAGRIVSHFAKGTVLRSSGVNVRIYEKPSVAPSLQDANRVRIPITIPYKVFH